MDGLMGYAADLAHLDLARAYLGIPAEAQAEAEKARELKARRAAFLTFLRDKHRHFFPMFAERSWGLVADEAVVSHRFASQADKYDYMPPFIAFAATDGWPAVYACLGEAMQAWEQERENLLERR